jgi:hypothetical protein
MRRPSRRPDRGQRLGCNSTPCRVGGSQRAHRSRDSRRPDRQLRQSRPPTGGDTPGPQKVGTGLAASRWMMGFPSSFYRVRTSRLWTKEGPHGTPTRHHHPDPAVRRRLQPLPALRIGRLRAADPQAERDRVPSARARSCCSLGCHTSDPDQQSVHRARGSQGRRFFSSFLVRQLVARDFKGVRTTTPRFS